MNAERRIQMKIYDEVLQEIILTWNDNFVRNMKISDVQVDKSRFYKHFIRKIFEVQLSKYF